MSTSVSFIGSGFSVASASSSAANVVRVKFNGIPKQLDPAGATDGLNPANYVLTGPTSATILSAASVGSDVESIDLNVNIPLPPGGWTVTVSNVTNNLGSPIVAPFSAAFEVLDSANATELTAGAEQDDAARIIRKHLSPAMQGPNWDGLIAALSTGDDTNWTNARLAFDQIFKSTASAKYLDRLAANDGLSRPPGTGMSDEIFRKLSIGYTNNKITQEAILEILRTFYGVDAVHAYADTDLGQPFSLQEAQTLTWTLDEDSEFSVTFETSHFTLAGMATADEVAAVMTKAMRDAGSLGWAVPVVDTISGQTKVRVYSGTMGLGSFVRITGGTAQPFLQFPQLIDVYTGVITTSPVHQWQVTTPRAGITRLTLTVPTVDVLVDLTTTEAGHYVVISSSLPNITPGVYPILDVSYDLSGPNTVQYFEILGDLGFVGAVQQIDNDQLVFFSPKKQSILDGSRTIVVAQTIPGQFDVSMPATSQAVNRSVGSGAYIPGVGDSPIDVISWLRGRGGSTIITTEDSLVDVLDVGDTIEINGFRSINSRGFFSPGTAGSPNLTGGGHWTSWTETPGHGLLLQESRATKLTNEDVLFSGGHDTSVVTGDATRVRPLGQDGVVDDDSTATGAPRWQYEYVTTASMGFPRWHHATSLLLTGEVLVSGGNNSFSAYTAVSDSEIYTPGSNAWSSSGIGHAAWDHTQTTLTSGEVLAIAGSVDEYNATSDVSSYSNGSGLWTTPAYNLAEARTEHDAIKLSDGRLLVTGGKSLGTQHDVTGDTLAYWPMTGTTNPTPDIANGNDLTVFGGATQNVSAKMIAGIDFAPIGYATTALSPPATTAALLGDWTIEFWLTGYSPASGVVVANKVAGFTGLEVDNTLLSVGIDGSGNVYWEWMHGAGITVSNTQTSPITPGLVMSLFGFAHVALKKAFNGGFPGSDYDVTLYVNGMPVETWSGQQNASGGDNSVWILGYTYKSLVSGVRVITRAVFDSEVRTMFVAGAGKADSPQLRHFGGDVLDTCEIFDPNTLTWSNISPMKYARFGHRTFQLADGSVLAVGGWGRDKSLGELPELDPNDFDSILAMLYWPNQPIFEAELWNPVTGQWSSAGRIQLGRVNFGAAYLPDSDKVWVGNSISDSNASPSDLTGGIVYFPLSVAPADQKPAIEIFDGATKTWSRSIRQSTNSFSTSQAQVLEDNIVVRLDKNNYGQLWIPGLEKSGTAGLNAVHRVSTAPGGTTSSGLVLDSNQIEVITPYSQMYASSHDFSGTWNQEVLNAGYGYYSFSNGASNEGVIGAVRTSNVTTLTLISDTSDFEIGQRIWVDMFDQALSASPDFSSGLKIVTAVTPGPFGTVSYAEVAPDATGVFGIGGMVLAETYPGATITKMSSDASPTGTKGPYTFDVNSGLALTGHVTTLTTAIRKLAPIGQMEVVSTAGFTDGVGYVVLDFGGPHQSPPIRYLETLSGQIVLLEYGQSFPYDYPVGTEVTFLVGRSPYVPASDIGNFWLTGSHLGRLAAQSLSTDASAAGILVDYTIVYPGDRGLGGEGYPVEGDGKLSDVTDIWGE